MPDQISSKIQIHLPINTKFILGESSALYITHMIKNIGVATLGVYIPLYIFQLDNLPKIVSDSTANAIIFVLSYYLARSVFSTILTGFLTNSIFGRLNFKKSIFLSTVFLSGFIFCLFLAEVNFKYIYLAALFNAVEVLLYWIPYHLLFCRKVNTYNEHFGHATGSRQLMVIAANTIGPLLGGLIISLYGFNALFAFGMVIILTSSIPVLVVISDDPHGKHNASKAFLRFFRKKEYIYDTVAYTSESIESILTPVLWTILLFITVESYLKIGLLKTISLIPIVFATVFVGKVIDLHGLLTTHKIGVIINSLLYLPRILPLTPISMYIIDILDRLNSAMYGIPFSSAAYERTKQSKHESDYIIYKEVARSSTAIIAMIVSMLFVYWIDNWKLIFLALAIISPFTYLISKSAAKHRKVLN